MDITNTQNDFRLSGFDRLKSTLTNPDLYRFDGTYKGIVTKCKSDTSRPLYVRVKIFGITDDLPSKGQPWARGSGNSSLPEPGTYVDIVFENGDVHFPVWSNPSKAKDRLVTKGQKQSRQNNQEIYNSQDGTTMSYDKATGQYTVSHSSGAKMSIDKDGVLSHESGPGGIPLSKYNVITEASICPYTGSPHICGSKYMQTSALPIG